MNPPSALSDSSRTVDVQWVGRRRFVCLPLPLTLVDMCTGLNAKKRHTLPKMLPRKDVICAPNLFRLSSTVILPFLETWGSRERHGLEWFVVRFILYMV